MKLKDLLKDIKVLNDVNIDELEIDKIDINSDNNLLGSLFICIKGSNCDTHKMKEVIKDKGAIAFVVEELDEAFNGTQILVKNTRECLSYIAKNFYCRDGIPKVIGITGTNGKTTTTFLTAKILETAGFKVGVIGTEGVFYNGEKFVLNMTTPDPIELFYHIGKMQTCGINYVIMEVSAHSISLNKINAINFYVKALTNITQDHLDFFETIENYKQCKVNFIEQDNCLKVVNADDESGYKIKQNNMNVVSYGIETYSDVLAHTISSDCTKFFVDLYGENIFINSKLYGKYNVENVLCAIAICNSIGVGNSLIQKGIKNFKAVDGRFNVYKKDDKMVVIDFAHTPDSLYKLLETIKKIKHDKLYCLFGCGGNRDTNKRAKMGKIASEIADYVYITDDNPRFEDSNDIAKMITSGINGNNYEIIVDREKAISKAISNMCDGDILAICGKGAENYMDIKGVKYPYSDKRVVETWGFKE